MEAGDPRNGEAGRQGATIVDPVAAFLERVFRDHADRTAMIVADRATTFAALAGEVAAWDARLVTLGVRAGDVVALESGLTAPGAAALLAALARQAIVLPIAPEAAARREEILGVAGPSLTIAIDAGGGFRAERGADRRDHPHYATLRARGSPGLLLVSSGSAGKCKAAVHDVARFLEKFERPRRAHRMLAFLLPDHVGGVDALFQSLSSGGCLVTAEDRTPDTLLAAVARHRVTLLPTSPSFLNLMLLSGAWRRHDLSSLEILTYGTEPMPEATLRKLREALPHVRLHQTYGLSEVGILQTRSREDGTLWIRLGGEGCETRIVDGTLHVRARGAMVGYLNAAPRLTEDGWLDTGDAVQVDGAWVRILGRRSELINVGGRKVWPAEVESVLLELDLVAEATVSGEAHPLLGQVVLARVALAHASDPAAARAAIRRHCAARLERFKVPVKITFDDGPHHGHRFKKVRSRG